MSYCRSRFNVRTRWHTIAKNRTGVRTKIPMDISIPPSCLSPSGLSKTIEDLSHHKISKISQQFTKLQSANFILRSNSATQPCTRGLTSVVLNNVILTTRFELTISNSNYVNRLCVLELEHHKTIPEVDHYM